MIMIIESPGASSLLYYAINFAAFRVYYSLHKNRLTHSLIKCVGSNVELELELDASRTITGRQAHLPLIGLVGREPAIDPISDVLVGRWNVFICL